MRPMTSRIFPQFYSASKQQQGSDSLQRLSRLTARLPVLLVLCWIVLYAFRPFQLGFYHDDWPCFVEPAHATAAFSLARLHWFIGSESAFNPRPLLGVVAFFVSSIFGTSAFGFQCASSLLVLLAALSLRSWFNALLGTFPAYRSLAADLAAIFWMAMPWMLGVTAWPVLAQTLVAQILFTEVGRRLLRYQQLTPKVAAQLAIALIACGLTYEAFYFEIFPLIALYAIWRRGPTRNARQTISLFAVCSVAQVIPIAYNRYRASLGLGPNKKFYPDWAHLFSTNLRALPQSLMTSLGEYDLLWAILFAVFAIGSLVLLSTGLFKKLQRPFCVGVVGILVLACGTLLVSDFTYSIAGYGFTSVGIGSRALYGPSFSLAILFFALSSCVFVDLTRYVRYVLVFAASAILAVMAFAQHERVAEWAHVWQVERQILSTTPVEQMSHLPPNSVILFAGPSEYKGIVIFGAPWDLTYAAFAQSPLDRARQAFKGVTTIIPVTDYFRFTWDGTTVVWEYPGYWVQKTPAEHVRVWRYGVPLLETASAGFKWPPAAAATFVGIDEKTQGTWKGIYGRNGFAVANDAPKYPNYAEVVLGGQETAIWAPSTDDVRALQRPLEAGRTAPTWFSASSFNIDLNFKDRNSHRVALYCLDWETSERAETIYVLDAVSMEVLDHRSISSFAGGKYAIWNLTGHVTIRIVRTGGLNAVAAGVFFDDAVPVRRETAVPPKPSPTTQEDRKGVQATARFVRIDKATQGAWKGLYGVDGFAIANDATIYPKYAKVVLPGTTIATWAPSTTDVRALQRPLEEGRMATTWFSSSGFSIDVDLTDRNIHRLALYCLDWETNQRAQTIDILDAASGKVLDSRPISEFAAGQYVVWEVSGHINVRTTRTGGLNAVVGGLFFDGGPAVPNGTAKVHSESK
jgi:hypothetical protein